MTLSGEQWLAQVFRPALAAVDHDRSAAGPLRALGGRLAAQVEALGDTGVLTDEQERAALDALGKAGIMPEIRSTSATMSTSAVAAPVAVRAGSAPVAPSAAHPVEPPVLRGVLAGPRQLGRLDGRPVTLISAELWSDRILVDLFTDPGQEHRDLLARATRERLERMKRHRRGQTVGPPGRAAGSPLQNLTWDLRDEHGTAYCRTGGSAESGHHVDRQRMQWSPAPPTHCERLTLLATDADGTVVFDAEIPVPRSAV